MRFFKRNKRWSHVHISFISIFINRIKVQKFILWERWLILLLMRHTHRQEILSQNLLKVFCVFNVFGDNRYWMFNKEYIAQYTLNIPTKINLYIFIDCLFYFSVKTRKDSSIIFIVLCWNNIFLFYFLCSSRKSWNKNKLRRVLEEKIMKPYKNMCVCLSIMYHISYRRNQKLVELESTTNIFFINYLMPNLCRVLPI